MYLTRCKVHWILEGTIESDHVYTSTPGRHVATEEPQWTRCGAIRTTEYELGAWSYMERLEAVDSAMECAYRVVVDDQDAEGPRPKIAVAAKTD